MTVGGIRHFGQEAWTVRWSAVDKDASDVAIGSAEWPVKTSRKRRLRLAIKSATRRGGQPNRSERESIGKMGSVSYRGCDAALRTGCVGDRIARVQHRLVHGDARGGELLRQGRRGARATGQAIDCWRELRDGRRSLPSESAAKFFPGEHGNRDWIGPGSCVRAGGVWWRTAVGLRWLFATRQREKLGTNTYWFGSPRDYHTVQV
jgi:hypothetical protein